MFPSLARYDRCAIDTETTGTSHKDRPVGLSLALPDGQDFYFAWGHKDGGNNCTLEQVINWAKGELKRPDLLTVFHNADFDLRMCAYTGISIKTRVEDTVIMSALLNELEPSFSLADLAVKYTDSKKEDETLNAYCANRYGGQPTRRSQAVNYWKAPGNIVAPYAKSDARATLALYDARREQIAIEDLERVYQLETRLIPILHKMHLAGIRVDVDRATSIRDELRANYSKLKAAWDEQYPGINYNSTQQIAPLFRKLGLPVWKTPAGNDSITKDLLENLDHPISEQIKKLKQNDYYAGTFIENYILSNVDEAGLVYPEFHQTKKEQYGTVSGRLSSGGGFNAQNIPSRDEYFGPLIRSLYIPISDDHWWFKFDYSQIEYRFLAHYAGGKLREQYVAFPDIDFHQMVAELTGLGRKPAKNINFGLAYGMGVKLLAIKLGLPLEEAKVVLNTYHERVPEVKQIYAKADRRAQARGFITTWGGRKRRFNGNTHKALNALLQGSAADLIKYAMVEVDKIIDWRDTVMSLTVHDELDFSIPKEDEETPRRIIEAMESFELTVPVKADAERGPNWGHVTDWP